MPDPTPLAEKLFWAVVASLLLLYAAAFLNAIRRM